ncbi:cytochrome C biogenesis protein [Microbacterium sp. Root61]|uniref:cytochrome c biogenesis protein ResB n=1 Tax=Microbacterium sp. Root61 TaxID=1736570 RepID=UPI0006F5B95E|nr:cytochrome c biogenesis protein ResB [Microbacterium sp. Root61]KRA24370.1 cytochrome C biogenesis protein [Microbacterium sp. Root61]
MSRSRSDQGSDPLRPSDHIDGIAVDDRPSSGGADDIAQPALGFVGWMRWGWRQLTSMRTALVLLLLLAIAAVPGSIVPQRSADPNGVTEYFKNNPDLAPVLDKMQLFDVYTSAWFSAIYILLFISLIGCVIPRTKHHWKALRARPPRTPARLSRLDDHAESLVELTPGQDAAALATEAVELASAQLTRAGYRVERYDGRGAFSVSAERGYIRETGNLVFHTALIGVLLAVGIGGGFTYTGQRVVVEGTTFVNAMTDYSSFNPGRFVNVENLAPYSMTLDSFDVTYQQPGTAGAGMAKNFAAHLTTQLAGAEESQDGVVRVNHPLDIAGDRIYLMGNGYAPTITVRNAEGEVVFHDSIPFLPQDTNLTSLGVVKVADGLPEQLGLVGFFYPTMQPLPSGAFTSVFSDLVYPVLTLNVYSGDLGIDDGTPRSVYTLDVAGMTQLTGGQTGVDSIQIVPGETADLPDGMGTVTLEDETAEVGAAVKRFVSLSIHRDLAGPWVLLFAVLALGGLMAALFVPRRRMWVKATPDGRTLRIEYAGLARGEDPSLALAVEQVAQKHGDALEASLRAAAAQVDPTAEAPAGESASSPRVD